MARVYVFADEGGDLVFKRGLGISQYFVIGTATMPDPAVGTNLLELRRELAWNGVVLPEFHAHNDKQRVRDRVFDVIVQSGVRVDATVLDKTKTQDHLRADPLRLYKEAWYLHFKYVAPRVCGSLDELFVVTSSLQIKRKKQAIDEAVRDVVQQVSPTAVFHTAFWPAISDPCLQVAAMAAREDWQALELDREREREEPNPDHFARAAQGVRFGANRDGAFEWVEQATATAAERAYKLLEPNWVDVAYLATRLLKNGGTVEFES
jgi:hypothetical protein